MKTSIAHNHPQDVYTAVLDSEGFGDDDALHARAEAFMANIDSQKTLANPDWDIIAIYWENQFLNKSVNDIESAFMILEVGARAGNRHCAAVLGTAIIFLYSRRQVVADGLSWLARAAEEGVTDAHYALLRWYSRRWNANDLRDYEDVDLGLDSCYEPTKKSPPVPFPSGREDCIRQAWFWALRGTVAGCKLCAEKVAGFDLSPEIRYSDIDLLRKAAATGNPSARLAYARYAYREDSSAKERRKAADTLRELAEDGFAEAQLSYAMAIESGPEDCRGTTPADAVKWYLAAAENGLPEAMRWLGVHLEKGDLVPADRDKAAEWFRKGAEAGEGNCQFFHGSILLENAQSDKDCREAARWIRRAAEENDVPGAWVMMSRFYTTGIGLYVNRKKAAACLKRAKELGWMPNPDSL